MYHMYSCPDESMYVGSLAVICTGWRGRAFMRQIVRHRVRYVSSYLVTNVRGSKTVQQVVR
jgi:hypothetical protein